MNKRRIFLQRQGYDDVLCAKSQQLNVDGTGAATRFILRGRTIMNELARFEYRVAFLLTILVVLLMHA